MQSLESFFSCLFFLSGNAQSLEFRIFLEFAGLKEEGANGGGGLRDRPHMTSAVGW